MNAAAWTIVGAFIGIAVETVGLVLAQRMGQIQITIARREHVLNVTKAMPKVGTSVTLKDQMHGAVGVLVVVTRIYNEGDLAASHLKGNWNLTCSESGFNRSQTISVDHLGNTRPHEFEMPFGGAALWQDVRNGKDVAIKVDLEFRYLGIPEEGEKTYKATYCYDRNQRQMVKQSN